MKTKLTRINPFLPHHRPAWRTFALPAAGFLLSAWLGTLAHAATTSLLPNDDITNATAVTSLPFTHVVSVAGATRADSDPYHCGGGPAERTVWYSLLMDHDAWVESSVLAMARESVLVVFTGQPGAFTAVTCNGNAAGLRAPLPFPARAGETYYFMAGTFGDTGTLEFAIAEVLPPANDDFANATLIGALPYTNLVNTIVATTADDDPRTCPAEATVWYSITPTEDVFLEAATTESDYPAGIGVYVGSRGALQPLHCTSGSGLRFEARQGQTYYIMVGNSAGQLGGHLQFTVRGYPPLKLRVSIDTVGGKDPKTGVAIIRGKVTSSQPGPVYLSGHVRQTVGRFHVINSAFGEGFGAPLVLDCDGECAWSVRVLSDDGAFGGGAAQVTVLAGVYDQASIQYVEERMEATVQLRGVKK